MDVVKTDEGLKTLLEQGREKGYLTYGQVNEYLPDDAVNPEKLDQLLLVLEDAHRHREPHHAEHGEGHRLPGDADGIAEADRGVAHQVHLPGGGVGERGDAPPRGERPA